MSDETLRHAVELIMRRQIIQAKGGALYEIGDCNPFGHGGRQQYWVRCGSVTRISYNRNGLQHDRSGVCNANKHRLLMPVGMMSGDTIVNRMKISGGTRVRVPTFDREKNYIVIAETDPGTQFEYDIKLSFFVAFDEFNGVKAGPAVGILDAIASEVDRVIRATEAECRRLGWE
jgi:hypothetical protein